MRRTLLLATVLVAAVLLPAGVASACSCAAASTAELRERAGAVFTATVVAVTPAPAGPDGSVSSSDPVDVTLRVDGVRKGPVRGERFTASLCGGSHRIGARTARRPRGERRVRRPFRVPVTTASTDGECGIDFRAGERWLVYADAPRADARAARRGDGDCPRPRG